MKLFEYLLAVFLCSIALPAAADEGAMPEKVTFAASDGLVITADVYLAHEDLSTPIIVLFHQAGWSRGEYREIAPRLCEMGFNCMAVDQRSGGAVNGVANETAARSEAAGMGTDYTDALPDLEAGLLYAHDHYAEGKVIAWGSSYSAGLVLKEAGDEPALVNGVLAFSPGEYFGNLGKRKTWIADAAKKIVSPVFVTSARNEKPNWEKIFEAVPTKTKISFVPETAGHHGSRALWREFDDSPACWKAVTAFLDRFVKEED